MPSVTCLGMMKSKRRTALRLVARGRPSRDAAHAFLRAEFPEATVLVLMLAIAVKPLSNDSLICVTRRSRAPSRRASGMRLAGGTRSVPGCTVAAR